LCVIGDVGGGGDVVESLLENTSGWINVLLMVMVANKIII
jgi:hypothetical protein